jgi:NAD(P)-dependent dehydrogenase (short-subunit alcohol dehydrogenase family)
MGLATAEAFAKAGAAVVLAVMEEALRTAAQKRADRGHKAIAVGCDVSGDAQVAGLVERTVAQFGRFPRMAWSV